MRSPKPSLPNPETLKKMSVTSPERLVPPGGYVTEKPSRQNRLPTARGA